MTQTVPRLRIGDVLIARGFLTATHLEVALNEQRRVHRPLGEILVSLGFVRAEQVAEVLAESLGLTFVRARDVHPDPVLVSAIEPEFVTSAGAFPVALAEGTLRVLMTDPTDPQKVSQVRQRFPYPLSFQVTTEADLTLLVRKHLKDRQSQVAQLLRSRGTPSSLAAEFPVQEVTQALIEDGIALGATDIHLEPEEKVTRVRYRVDGLLQQAENLPRTQTDAIISRLKILANLDIAERRLPQDGRIRAQVSGRSVDMRVSVMPCSHGENVVLRILDRSGGCLRLAQTGLSPHHARLLARISERPHGLLLVTGPTGSGKTTTLYGILGEVDALSRNVATIEDPVEYDLSLIRQSQIEPAAGFDFQSGLRALLRQDPDVILVGEIRDQETAAMAVKAAMTGHLVFSTLHTNSAIGAVPRLIDLGIAPYLIEDALIGVLAQRLVRKVCDGCGEPAEATPEELAWLDGDAGQLRRGTGCENCRNSGYSGRTVIAELFLPDEQAAAQLRAGDDPGRLLEMALAAGFRTMTEDGKAKVRQGITTPEEVKRVNLSHRLSPSELEDI